MSSGRALVDRRDHRRRQRHERPDRHAADAGGERHQALARLRPAAPQPVEVLQAPVDGREVAGRGVEARLEPEHAAEHALVDHEALVEEPLNRLLGRGDILAAQPLPDPVLVRLRALVVEHAEPVRQGVRPLLLLPFLVTLLPLVLLIRLLRLRLRLGRRLGPPSANRPVALLPGAALRRRQAQAEQLAPALHQLHDLVRGHAAAEPEGDAEGGHDRQLVPAGHHPDRGQRVRVEGRLAPEAEHHVVSVTAPSGIPSRSASATSRSASSCSRKRCPTSSPAARLTAAT